MSKFYVSNYRAPGYKKLSDIQLLGLFLSLDKHAPDFDVYIEQVKSNPDLNWFIKKIYGNNFSGFYGLREIYENCVQEIVIRWKIRLIDGVNDED